MVEHMMVESADEAVPFDELSGGQVADFATDFRDAWNSHVSRQLAQMSNPDIIWEDPYIQGGRLVGHEALTLYLTSVWRSMPDLTFEIVGSPYLALDRRSAVIAWRGAATMTGPLDPPGFAPTHRRVDMIGVDTHWLRGGRLAHVRTITDVMAVGRQIGAAPAEGGRSERLGVAMQRVMARRMRKSVR